MDFDMENSHPVPEERMAIPSGNFDIVKKLVRDNCSINKPDLRGWTLLHEAAISDQFADFAKFLLSAGAIVDYKTPNGVTPFYIACKHECETIARMLIEAGCNINATAHIDYAGNKCCLNFTPLHIACYHRNLAIIKLLLENNASLNVKEGRGRTPIHFAIDNSNAAAVRMLIEAGANLKIKDSQGYTPLHHACISGNLEMLNILLEHLGSGKSIIDQQTPEGWTLLMLACNFQHYAIAERLIECGANTTVVNCIGLLALHLAAHSELDLFKLVLENTPKDAIEKCASFRNSFQCYRSIPCIIIDSKAYESLELFYRSGVSEAVLKCPTKLRGHLLSPLGHLLLFTNSSLDNEKRLKFLEFLLSHEFLINPIYGDEDNPQSTISLFEAVVQMHSHFHEDCLCETFLSLILSKVSSPQIGLPHKSSKQIALFNKAARAGFVAALGLLRYTEYIEPDDVMKMFLSDMSGSHYRWTGHEAVATKFLLEKCTTNFMPKVLEIKNSITELMPGDMLRQAAFISIYNEIKSNVRVVSLKRMCRFALRKEIREQAKASSQSFQSYLQNILSPPFLSKYLLYEMDF